MATSDDEARRSSAGARHQAPTGSSDGTEPRGGDARESGGDADGHGRDQPIASGKVSQPQRKAQVLTSHAASGVRSIADAIVIKDAEPFFLCPPDGQISVSQDHGFGIYHHDTRFLSGYELRLADATANALAATAVAGNHAILELTTPDLDLGNGRKLGKEQLAIRWSRRLDAAKTSLRDEISIRSYATEKARLKLSLRFRAGFQDVFDVRGLLQERPGTLHQPRWDGDRLVFAYDGKDGVTRSVTVSFDVRPRHDDGPGCDVWLEVPPRGESKLTVTVELGERLQPGAAPIEHRTPKRSEASQSQRDSRAAERPGSSDGGWPTSVRTDSISLEAVLARSLDDLLTLRGELDGQRYYAAGVPWFSTLFGRDSLISAYQTLAFEPRIAGETLRLLAGRQGTTDDDFRDEQPGKILHELRIGELARLHEIPHTPYYGSIDATPLFLVVLARHAAWTGDLGLFRDLRSNVDRALAWIDGASDSGGGYLAYESEIDHGLVNQGWKDSGNAIVTADGNLAHPPIALAEVQGYVYAAKREIAELFERDGDTDRATQLRSQADDLQRRFERDFWSDDLGCYVLALEADNKPCAVVASNAGQVLWSGIAGQDHAAKVAQRLLGDDAFGGWGIRTLSTGAVAYNPIAYHLGTVWPHDNGLIAEGFRRYDLDDEAERVFSALVEASTDFPQQRLPECYAGYAREEFGIPVRYPIACHPQAWAAGAVPHLLTATLGLVPEAFDRRLRIERPRLPHFARHLEIRDLAVGDAKVDLVFDRTEHETTARVDRVEGELDVRIEA
ncbi:MAG TPA: glycogen debranching N-terminal domain-containing protein [Candidatus Limnocylindrales bacterium]|nr:glycogen debranching N-terminal domain-containing protein [Candidatus Limnocylindrales bacterium]